MTSKLETLVSVISSSSGSPLIYAYEKPSTITDCIVYRQISSVPIKCMTKNLMDKTRIQLTCYGTTLAKSRTLAEKMKTLLDLNRTSFTLSCLENDVIEKELDTGLFLSYLDFFIW